MSSRILFAQLSCGENVVTLNGVNGFSDDGLAVSSDGIDGWYSTPDAKVSMTEMETGDGAHRVSQSEVLYSARTVTLGWLASGSSRASTLAAEELLLSFVHKIVRLRVVDADLDTYCDGYVQVGADDGVAHEGVMSGSLTVVCADPRRYSTQTHAIQLFPTASVSGGLFYGSGGDGLVYPLNYGASAETLQNVGTLQNDGTSTAYPTITITGPIEQNARVDWDGGSVSYSQPVLGVPLTLDSLTRTASIAGLDVSRNLTSRGFPSIPAGGSITASLQAYGTGWATVEWRDTYI